MLMQEQCSICVRIGDELMNAADTDLDFLRKIISGHKIPVIPV
jgi:hypothetical protein